AAYAASKGGLNALGEVLRLEGRGCGIRVITLCPAQIDTELWDGKAPDSVRARMMTAAGVGELVASLVHTDRRIDIGPIVIRPVRDPWVEPGP
ncbi:MAG: SDR family NAD(P)-dependent oxidoreductase, partial [Acidimicrobiaceae bacterium]|nr:SDR family NAD(P)-dependent oxidoreductase [Acidimicrobiaceae bacterium]